MSENDTFLVKIYVLLSPFLLLLTPYVAVKAADWVERREQRHHAAE